MGVKQADFDQAVWAIVLRIRPGSVMSYGEVARAAGFPRHARMVSKAMVRSPDALPWFRVIRSNQTLAFKEGSDSYKKQAALLEKEGVKIIQGKVIPLDNNADKSLDELLWG